MRVADNRIHTVLGLYRSELAALYPEAEARAIARTVFHERMGMDASQLEMRKFESLSESELLKVYEPLKRLVAGEPLQYILGTVRFHGLVLEVGPGVLIPRPETEELVERIIGEGVEPACVTDIGTGSGCIALALKRACPMARVIGLDVSEATLAIARRNALRNGLDVEWRKADALDPDFALPPGTDLVVSNPPYVPRGEAGTLAPLVRDHEPDAALFVDDDDPLLFYRAIAGKALDTLPAGGRLRFEGHYRHAAAAGAMLEAMGFRKVAVDNDLSGNPRFISAER